jgi:hypothetical protein
MLTTSIDIEVEKLPSHTGGGLLPTEEEINEWTRRSRKEGICGIVNCFNKPTKQCKKCTNYYCSGHFPSHLDLLPDSSDFDCNNNSSSNDGLELYMEENESDDSD